MKKQRKDPLDSSIIDALKLIPAVNAIEKGITVAKAEYNKPYETSENEITYTFKKASRLGSDLFELKQLAYDLKSIDYPEMRQEETKAFLFSIETKILMIVNEINQKISTYDNF